MDIVFPKNIHNKMKCCLQYLHVDFGTFREIDVDILQTFALQNKNNRLHNNYVEKNEVDSKVKFFRQITAVMLKGPLHYIPPPPYAQVPKAPVPWWLLSIMKMEVRSRDYHHIVKCQAMNVIGELQADLRFRNIEKITLNFA